MSTKVSHVFHPSETQQLLIETFLENVINQIECLKILIFYAACNRLTCHTSFKFSHLDLAPPCYIFTPTCHIFTPPTQLLCLIGWRMFVFLHTSTLLRLCSVFCLHISTQTGQTGWNWIVICVNEIVHKYTKTIKWLPSPHFHNKI